MMKRILCTHPRLVRDSVFATKKHTENQVYDTEVIKNRCKKKEKSHPQIPLTNPCP
eukprot:UN25630